MRPTLALGLACFERPARPGSPEFVPVGTSAMVSFFAPQGNRRSQADVAQLVERNLAKVEVASSSLVVRSERSRSLRGGLAERRGNGLQIRQHGFESRTHLNLHRPSSTLWSLAQWERASLTRKRSLVQTQYRPPDLQVSGPSRASFHAPPRRPDRRSPEWPAIRTRGGRQRGPTCWGHGASRPRDGRVSAGPSLTQPSGRSFHVARSSALSSQLDRADRHRVSCWSPRPRGPTVDLQSGGTQGPWSLDEDLPGPCLTLVRHGHSRGVPFGGRESGPPSARSRRPWPHPPVEAAGGLRFVVARSPAPCPTPVSDCATARDARCSMAARGATPAG